jgi:hypothetical protein
VDLKKLHDAHDTRLVGDDLRGFKSCIYPDANDI